ncbi:unnamed protein product, partial [Amoebophrya sp. A25]|eukprot:GSA25T00009044001.1
MGRVRASGAKGLRRRQTVEHRLLVVEAHEKQRQRSADLAARYAEEAVRKAKEEALEKELATWDDEDDDTDEEEDNEDLTREVESLVLDSGSKCAEQDGTTGSASSGGGTRTSGTSVVDDYVDHVGVGGRDSCSGGSSSRIEQEQSSAR